MGRSPPGRSMHVTKQPRRDAKTPLERVIETDRRKAHSRCDAFEWQVTVNKRACGLEAQGLDKMSR